MLARNLIPVVGIYAFGWSAALSVFSYWFDGLTALAAIITALVPRALRESQPAKEAGKQSSVTANPPVAGSGIGAKTKIVVSGVVTWVFLVGIVGLPYWIVLLPLHHLLLGEEVRQQLAHSPALWFHLRFARRRTFLESGAVRL